MVKKKMIPVIKKLIIAKKLFVRSQKLIEKDSLENNLIAIFNLNSALNIVLEVLSEQQSVKSVKQIKGWDLEQQWEILSKEYKKRYSQELSMKTQIFTLNTVIDDFTKFGQVPNSTQVHELGRALGVFIEELIFQVFEIKFSDLDFHYLIDHPQVKNAIKNANKALNNDRFDEVLKETSTAFHIALEEQRQKLNYLSAQDLLKPDLLMLEKSIKLHIDPKDQDFIHLILRTNPKKLERFKQLIPTAVISEDENNRPEIVISDFVDNAVLSYENAEFCLNFVLETILHWESLDLLKRD